MKSHRYKTILKRFVMSKYGSYGVSFTKCHHLLQCTTGCMGIYGFYKVIYERIVTDFRPV